MHDPAEPPARPRVTGVADTLERRQVPLYVGAIAAGVVVGLLAPAAGPGLATAVNPVLAALLFVTFLQVPARELAGSLRAGRFLGAVLVVNFAVVPPVVALLALLLPADDALRAGVLLVLLAPCVDYVVVFSRLAGAAADRLLAATPLLLLSQIVLLPVYLRLLLGPGFTATVDLGPFVQAFLTLIVVPLVLAWSVQLWAARTRSGAAFAAGAATLMVPLMVATLLVVVASQVPTLGGDPAVLVAVPVYVAFLLVMPVLGLGVAWLLRLAVPEARAVVFSGATRNSLVVLPLALALPAGAGVAAAAVVTQTLVEVLGMVAYVRLVPLLVRVPARAP
ncbi:arsenic resistance protein [Pseudonocardia sp. D17]|uniref:arsenic resistance protein n=1 Tax=Pseudonocardia sp. D17 TaxID=882661 RepID=UPI0030D5575D|nr:arsenic resistance protein [Pseudonocardia sp. D17]